MADSRDDLRRWTKTFAVNVIRLYASLPKRTEAQVVGQQVLRSGTSVGAHYREACRARSTTEFISKLELALQELDESMYWLELVQDGEIFISPMLTTLLEDADAIIGMLTASVRTVKRNQVR